MTVSKPWIVNFHVWFENYQNIHNYFFPSNGNRSVSRILSKSKIEPFPKTVNNFKPLTLLAKCSIQDVWQGSEWVFLLHQNFQNCLYCPETCVRKHSKCVVSVCSLHTAVCSMLLISIYSMVYFGVYDYCIIP